MPQKLKDIVETLNELLSSTALDLANPDPTLGEIMDERAKHACQFDTVAALATRALDTYSFNPELLRIRAHAKSRIVTPQPDVSFPLLESAQADLQLLLELEPHDVCTAGELLDLVFTHSEIEDADAAERAGELAAIAAEHVLRLRSLQIRALGRDERLDEAEELYRIWSAYYPDADSLRCAIEAARSVNRQP